MNSIEKDPSVMASETASPSPQPQDGAVHQLTQELRALAHDHIELATLETRLAFLSALKMAIVAIVSAIALVGVWLALMGAAALALISLGLAPVLAMLLVAAANLLLAFVGWLYVRKKSRSLGWPATQRAIKPPPAAGTREITE